MRVRSVVTLLSLALLSTQADAGKVRKNGGRGNRKPTTQQWAPDGAFHGMPNRAPVLQGVTGVKTISVQRGATTKVKLAITGARQKTLTVDLVPGVWQTIGEGRGIGGGAIAYRVKLAADGTVQHEAVHAATGYDHRNGKFAVQLMPQDRQAGIRYITGTLVATSGRLARRPDQGPAFSAEGFNGWTAETYRTAPRPVVGQKIERRLTGTADADILHFTVALPEGAASIELGTFAGGAVRVDVGSDGRLTAMSIGA